MVVDLNLFHVLLPMIFFLQRSIRGVPQRAGRSLHRSPQGEDRGQRFVDESCGNRTVLLGEGRGIASAGPFPWATTAHAVRTLRSNEAPDFVLSSSPLFPVNRDGWLRIATRPRHGALMMASLNQLGGGYSFFARSNDSIWSCSLNIV